MPVHELESRLQAGPRARLQAGSCVVLDGATGTELERRGYPTGLPLWSAAALWDHPTVVTEIHADYARAGVDFLTANTFRTQRRTLARAGRGADAAELTTLAVKLAAEGANAVPTPPGVLGSAPTLEDCYRPQDVPPDEALRHEHAEHAEHLARAGADAILVETMNTVREAVAAAQAASAVGLPFFVSFVCWDGPQLLSGEPLEAAIEAVATLEPAAVAVNCLPPANAAACLPVLAASGLPFGVYANLGTPDAETGFARNEAPTPSDFARHATQWIAAGARLVGGCCGTTPDHMRAVVEQVRA